MRGCTCTGMTLCPQCQAWADTVKIPQWNRELRTEVDEPETAFQSRIIRLARQHGWLCHHSHDSRRNEWGCDAGLPDLILVRESILFAELKTRTGKLTAEQMRWLTMLSHTDSRVEMYIWRPADWPTIEARLTQPWRRT